MTNSLDKIMKVVLPILAIATICALAALLINFGLDLYTAVGKPPEALRGGK